MTDCTSPDQHTSGETLIRSLGSAFRRQGEELYVVGGAVRDPLLGLEHFDLDFATSSLPERTVKILTELKLNKPYRLGERFGTIGVPIDGRSIEITTYRAAETYREGSRKPDVRFGHSLLEDLERRDFTVNAMARDPLSGELIDPFGGKSDLTNGIIRAVGIAEERFADDPLRLLRAVRFAASLGFIIDPGTWRALTRQAGSLRRISRERIRDEYSRIILGDEPAEGIALLRDSGLLAVSVPELLELTQMADHGPRHPLSLWDHTMRVVSAVPQDIVIRWAALLHDIAKPSTRSHDADGRPRFFRHEDSGAQTARHILRGLRYPNWLVRDVALLIETHMQLHAYSSEWTDGALRRLMVKLGPLLKSALALARADASAHVLIGEPGNASRYGALEARALTLEQEPAERLKSPLNGDQLMQRYGFPPGPWIRSVKDALQNQVMEGNLNPEDVASVWLLADELVRVVGSAR